MDVPGTVNPVIPLHSHLRVMLAALVFAAVVLEISTAAQPRAVFVTASLIDRNNLPVENLGAEEVRIFEDGRPREPQFVVKEDLPTVYGLLFERALLSATESYDDDAQRSSLAGSARRWSAQDIAFELIDKYLGYHPVWVASYGRETEISGNLAADGAAAKELIQKIPRGVAQESFLYPAIFSAVQSLNQRHERRRVLFLLLGSMDAETSSRMRPLKNLVSRSNVELFVVSFASKRAGPSGGIPWSLNAAGLRDLAQSTCGEALFSADYGEHPSDLIRRLGTGLRSLHTFGFESTSAADAPGKLRIECLRPGVKVRSRSVVPILQ